MGIGSIADVINAQKVELILDPTGTDDEFVTLQDLTMPLERQEIREEVALGSVYFYSQHDNSFEATMLFTALDAGLYLDNNSLVNGGLPKRTYDVRLTSKALNVTTIRLTAVTPGQTLEKPPTGGTKIRQRFRITEEVNSGNIQ